MAGELIPCSGCGRPIGDYREQCPFCNQPTGRRPRARPGSDDYYLKQRLDRVRTEIGDGRFKAALEDLWFAESAVRDGEREEVVGEMRRLTAAVRRNVSGSLLADCEDLDERLEGILARRSSEGTPEILIDALGSVSDCRVVAAAGVPLQADADRSLLLVFREDRVVLAPRGVHEPSEEVEFAWQGLELSIEGAGMVKSGGGFVGGGFGLVGIAAGMLTATALNALTTSTGIETFVHLQTPSADVYLYHGGTLPDELRRTLAPVFLHLRQQNPKESAQPGGDANVVDRLNRLAKLLDRGLIDESEFAKLKADLLRGID